MKHRLVLMTLIAGCVLFAAAGAFVYLGKDRTAPEITIKKEEISYTEGEDTTVLLTGVTAKDNIDGDLTDQVFVDRIIQTGKDTAVVYYGVMDQSYNVATARRKIEYHPAEGAAAEDADASSETPEETENTPEEPAEEPAAEETEAETEAGAEETLQPDGARPALALTASELTITAGTAFDPMSVVKDAVDDVDSRDTLYQRISANGSYDTATPGTYTIEYFVTDSSGNTSDPQIFTLKVQ